MICTFSDESSGEGPVKSEVWSRWCSAGVLDGVVE